MTTRTDAIATALTTAGRWGFVANDVDGVNDGFAFRASKNGCTYDLYKNDSPLATGWLVNFDNGDDSESVFVSDRFSFIAR